MIPDACLEPEEPEITDSHDKGRMMTVGSLFAGIGGFDLGLERAGMKVKWQVEIDPFCRKVLATHWPSVARYEDVKEVGHHNLESVDVICGGFPCQDNSHGKQWWGDGRQGLSGDKSSLWWEMWRVVCELQPTYVVLENVSGLLTVNGGHDFRSILECLAKGGFSAEWEVLCASHFGAPHHRERLYLVAYSSSLGQASIFNQGIDLEQTTPQELRVLTGATVQIGGHWAHQPGVDLLADGVPQRACQIEGLGNAVVPQVVEWIGHRIIEIEEKHCEIAANRMNQEVFDFTGNK